MRVAIGIDLGGTKIDLGILDESGRIYEWERLKTDVERGAQAIEDQIIESARRLQKKTGFPLLGAGIGVAGQIHPVTGAVAFAPNLKWHNVPLRETLEKALQIPVRVLNDVRALTMGEWLYGAGKGCNDFLSVFLGTGIGSGFVSRGHLLTGCSNSFGEIGHITIDFNGPLCTCGKRGCFEAYAGGWGIAARAKEKIEADSAGAASRKLLELAEGGIKNVTAKTVVAAYRLKDPMAVEIINTMERALIAGFSSLVNAFNPCRLILGGGLIDGLPEIPEIVEKGVRKEALKSSTETFEVVKAQLGKEFGVLGPAAAIFKEGGL